MTKWFGKYGVMALALALLWAAPAHLALAQGARQTLVGVDVVRREPLTQTVPVIGRLVARQSGDVAAQVDGAVRRILVEVGDHVKKGDIIALLDTETRKARRDVLVAGIAESRAALAAAKADLELARLNMERQGKLKKTGAFNRALFETTQQAFAKAGAELARAHAAIAAKKASLALIDVEIDRARVTSPYDAVVVERKTEAGSYLRSGDAVVTLVAVNQLEIEADVPAIRLAGLDRGVTVRAVLEDGTTFRAVVRAGLPVENARTRTRPVRFVAKWPAGIARLAQGQSVTVYIPAGKSRQIVTVHKDAIISQRGHDVVFIVTNGKAEPRNVTLGVASGSRIEVTKGLKAGDLAVVRGNERLRPGMAVRLRKDS